MHGEGDEAVEPLAVLHAELEAVLEAVVVGLVVAAVQREGEEILAGLEVGGVDPQLDRAVALLDGSDAEAGDLRVGAEDVAAGDGVGDGEADDGVVEAVVGVPVEAEGGAVVGALEGARPVAGSRWAARVNFASPVPHSCFASAASASRTESFM